MGTTSPRKPTNAELLILRVLWENGPSTVRQVLEKLSVQRSIRYTSVLKLLQIMTAKRLVLRDESERTHRYRAASNENQTQRRLVSDLISRVFGGSAQRLIVHALDVAKASPEEMAEVRKLLRQASQSKRTRED